MSCHAAYQYGAILERHDRGIVDAALGKSVQPGVSKSASADVLSEMDRPTLFDYLAVKVDSLKAAARISPLLGCGKHLYTLNAKNIPKNATYLTCQACV